MTFSKLCCITYNFISHPYYTRTVSRPVSGDSVTPSSGTTLLHCSKADPLLTKPNLSAKATKILEKCQNKYGKNSLDCHLSCCLLKSKNISKINSHLRYIKICLWSDWYWPFLHKWKQSNWGLRVIKGLNIFSRIKDFMKFQTTSYCHWHSRKGPRYS